MSVEGMSKAAIARVLRVSWNTVDRWLERAESAARRWSRTRTRGYPVEELQFDEARVVRLDDQANAWVHTGMEVGSRLWTSTLISTRTYWNTYRLIWDSVDRGRMEAFPLVFTDGMKYYRWAVHRVFRGAVVYGQVLKEFKRRRLVKVERVLIVGTRRDLAKKLELSEDSETINTAFIERLNLTIRQSSAYLRRKTSAHPRSMRRLAGSLELLRAWYNFCRPHRGLKFGRECRTPAQLAGLATRRMRLLEILRWRACHGRSAPASLDVYRKADGIHDWQLAG